MEKKRNERQVAHLDYLSWRETCSALHLYLQVAGEAPVTNARFPFRSITLLTAINA
ncbi:hypothetical protein [Mesorhizobium sp. L-2-11]|uniref:hypothetical protein n=1 Tax=Mesorhizobium sp. L-2-11 TaxID=2744521 RepID=UPI0019293647|nr:hypothetical protein [Mesorhizobium sp. L-2-11]